MEFGYSKKEMSISTLLKGILRVLSHLFFLYTQETSIKMFFGHGVIER